MERSLHLTTSGGTTRPRGAHRFEVFSLKLNRRLTFYRRAMLDAWVLIETDPSVVAFSEYPGTIQIGERRRFVDFSVRYVDREELLISADAVLDGDDNFPPAKDLSALALRLVPRAELVAARVWIDNWHRMLPSIVATRGLIPASLLNGIERFTKQPQQLMTIEREFSTGDPTIVRAATFRLLHAGRLTAPDLRTESLSLLTPFVEAGESL
jgi:hypothetical protein